MPEDVPVQGLGEGVLNAVLQPGDGGLLGDHVHHHIGGQAPVPVGEPLDEVGVGDGSHPDRPALVVDLGGVIGVFILADHVAEGAHLPVAQVVGGVPVQGGNVVEGDLGHVLGKVPGLDGEQVPVGFGPEDDAARDAAHQSHHQQGDSQKEGHRALLFQELEVLLHALPPEAGGEHGADAVNHAQQQHKGVKVLRLEVEGGQLKVEVEKAHRQGDQQIDGDPGHGALNRLPGLFGP